MTVLDRNPLNTNPLQPTKFLLTFNKIPNTQYFCQEINLPGLSLGDVEYATPFIDLHSPGTKLKFDDLDINFIVDEDLETWKDLYKWFISIADPNGFGNRVSKDQQYSDAILTILSALNNPIIRIQFKNCFPLSLGSIDFDTKSDADHIMTCRASFRYQSYEYLTA